MDEFIPDVAQEMINALHDDCKKLVVLESCTRPISTFSSDLRKRSNAVVTDPVFLAKLVELEAFRMILEGDTPVVIVIVGGFHTANLVKLLATVGIYPVEQNWEKDQASNKIYCNHFF